MITVDREEAVIPDVRVYVDIGLPRDRTSRVPHLIAVARDGPYPDSSSSVVIRARASSMASR